MRLSIVVGALKEEKRLGRSMIKLHAYLDKAKLLSSTELIIVSADGGDNTVGVAEKHGGLFPHFRIIQPGLPVGKGRDIKLGMEVARGEVALFMDADLATPLHHIQDALNLVENHAADIVIGVRNIRRMHKTKARLLISLMGNLAFSIVSGRYVPDTQCGFKAFNRKAKEVCFARQTIMGWGFDMELLIIAFENGLDIAQLPVSDWEDLPGGTFSGGLRNTLRFGKDLLSMLGNRVSGRYNQKRRNLHE